MDEEKTITPPQPPKKGIRPWVLIVSVLIAVVLSVAGTLYGVRSYIAQAFLQTTAQTPSTSELSEVEKVYQYLKEGYVDKNITSEQLINGALKGMAEAVGDPYTSYLVNDETAQLDETVTGSFGGIGAELKSDQGRVLISTTMEGTPSRDVGLQADDAILKVDGEDMTGKSISQVVQKVRGEVGTTVTLTIERAGQALDVTLTRASISIQTVRAELDKDHPTVGHIRITSFAKNTAQEVQDAVENLTNQGATSFVFDVRHNPGGLLDQALKISNMFLQNGQTILQIEDRNGNVQKYTASDEYGTFKITAPYVLLVDEGSASASEILTGALKESAGATIIGTKTYGKGTVQSVVDISQNSELKYTNAKWLTPDGNWIHEKGIDPTQEVKLPDYATLTIIDTRETIQEGAVSNSVLTIEKILEGLGYSVTADGYYDSGTTSAVRTFQEREGLAVTGSVDADTATRLMQRVRELIAANDTQYQAAVQHFVQ